MQDFFASSYVSAMTVAGDFQQILNHRKRRARYLKPVIQSSPYIQWITFPQPPIFARFGPAAQAKRWVDGARRRLRLGDEAPELSISGRKLERCVACEAVLWLGAAEWPKPGRARLPRSATTTIKRFAILMWPFGSLAPPKDGLASEAALHEAASRLSSTPDKRLAHGR